MEEGILELRVKGRGQDSRRRQMWRPAESTHLSQAQSWDAGPQHCPCWHKGGPAFTENKHLPGFVHTQGSPGGVGYGSLADGGAETRRGETTTGRQENNGACQD